MMRYITLVAGIAALVTGCAVEPDIYDSESENWEGANEKSDSSAVAVFLDFEFDGQLVTRSCFNPRSAVDEQLLYTVGQLNGEQSVGRLDRLKITNVQANEVDGGCSITYHAVIPVAWGKRRNVPENYTFLLPLDVSHDGTSRFMEDYEHSCLDWGAHDVTAGIFWYYYRPGRSSCQLNPEHVIRAQATVSPSAIQTTGKYPEYHKIWEDDVFEVVAIFGKVNEGGGNSDGGVRGYDKFVKSIRNTLDDYEMTSVPEDIPNNPGTDMPEITLNAVMDDGRKVRVSAFLIDSVGSAPSAFWQRYEALTPTADFIVYNGHSGLGANIRKLARKGEWAPGQYTIVFMNGCDTYAYVDSALADAHAAVNEDDDEGTKYLDVVANAMPSLFRSMPQATMALVDGLLDWRNPKTYEEMFEDIDKSEVVLVTGEHDNVYEPGFNDFDTF